MLQKNLSRKLSLYWNFLVDVYKENVLLFVTATQLKIQVRLLAPESVKLVIRKYITACTYVYIHSFLRFNLSAESSLEKFT